MILRELYVRNFRQITGEYTIKFALPGDRPVTVLLGENGSGKSTLLQACLWGLYGRKDFENPEDIISYRALEEAKPREEVMTTVRLILQDGNDRIYVERNHGGPKGPGGRIEFKVNQELRAHKVGPDGETHIIHDAGSRIERMLPEDLAGFFFFRGEDLEQLVAQAGADKLKTAVEQFVDLVVLERAINHLGRVEKELEQKLRATTDGKAHELTEQIDELKQRIQAHEDAVEGAQKKRKQLEEQIEAIEEELHGIEAVRPFIERKQRLEGDREHLADSIREKRTQLAKLISRDGYLFLRSPVLRTGTELAEQARQKGELPALIKPMFVEDLLSEGVCCCGTPIDTNMRERLEGWKASIKLADLESHISELKANLRHLDGRAHQFKSDYNETQLDLAQLNEELRIVDENYSSVLREIEGKDFKLEYVTGLQQTLSQLRDDLVKVRIEEETYIRELNELNEKNDNLHSQRNKYLKAQKKGVRIGRQITTTRKVREGLNKLKSGWVSIVQEFLDVELKSKWKAMAQLDRLVEFDPQFRLNIKERGGDGQWRKSAPSSANKRALALGFVASLIKLADEARKGQKDGNRLFSGGQYPLVMDAPFATMDKHFKLTVPAGLREVVPQLILATSHDQWSGEVESTLGSAVGAAYVLELHKPGESSSTVPFQGTVADYVVGEADTMFDWTEIHKVK